MAPRPLALLSGLVLAAASASAGQYYVSPAGSNANDGSIGSPWLTIAHALDNSGPGDTVNLRAGTYAGPIEMRGDWGHGGSPGNWWVLQSYPGETATVTATFRIYMVSYCRVQNLNFAGVSLFTGLFTTGGYTTPHHVEILNNTFTGLQQTYGYIQIHGNDILVEGNTIASTGGGSTQDHGIYVLHGTNKVVRNNRISNTSGYGIHVYDERKQPGDPQTFLVGMVVEGNTVTGSRLRSGIIVSQGGDTQVDGVIVRNNVLVSNQQYGVSISNYGSLNLKNVRVYNNTFYRNLAGGVFVYASPADVEAAQIRNNVVWSDNGVNHLQRGGTGVAPVAVSRNLYWTAPRRLVNLVDSSPVEGDPLFASAGSDFHLSAGSPGVDAGESLAEVPTDKDGVPRPQGSAYDIGAYETATTSSATPLRLFTVSPCRLVDTRQAGPLGGPALAAGGDRVFTIVDTTCGIPSTAKAVSVNVAVTSPTAAGSLRLYPAGSTVPLASAINYSAGQTRANNAVAALNGAGQVAVRCTQASGTVHFILDVNGYFE
jgi:hypothetical protein